MLDNENMVVNDVPTPEQTINSGNNPQIANTLNNVSDNKPELYTKEQVKDLMRKRVQRSHNSFFNRYGVNNLEGLDALFDKTKQFDQMNNEYSNIMLKNAELTQINAFLKNNIEPTKYDDIKAYFKGTGADFSEEALLSLLETHPEWLKKQPTQVETTPITTIKQLGSEAHSNPVEDEESKMKRIFNV